jgi:hypothetical protein
LIKVDESALLKLLHRWRYFRQKRQSKFADSVVMVMQAGQDRDGDNRSTARCPYRKPNPGDDHLRIG